MSRSAALYAVLAAALRSVLELSRSPDIVERCRARAGEFALRGCIEAYEQLYAELLSAAGV